MHGPSHRFSKKSNAPWLACSANHPVQSGVAGDSGVTGVIMGSSTGNSTGSSGVRTASEDMDASDEDEESSDSDEDSDEELDDSTAADVSDETEDSDDDGMDDDEDSVEAGEVSAGSPDDCSAFTAAMAASIVAASSVTVAV